MNIKKSNGRRNEMLNNKNKKIIFALLRSLIVFFLFIGIIAASRKFVANYISNIDEISSGFANKFLNYWCLLIAIFAFNSLARSIKLNNRSAKERYLKRCPCEQSFLANVRDTFRDIEFWIEIAIIAVFSLLLPLSITYSFISPIFFGGLKLSPTVNKACTLCVVLPILFIIELFASTSARNHYRYDKPPRKRRNEIVQNILSLIIIAAIYSYGFGYLLMMLFPFVATICNAFRGHNPFEVFGVVIGITLAAIGFVYVFAYIRAIKLRRAFIKELKDACQRMGARLSEIKNPYSSIFGKKTDISFTVEKSGKKYDCKLVASVLKSTPMTFFDSGDMMSHYTFRMFKIDIFHFVTQAKFEFQSDGAKILVILPVPKKFFVASTSDETPRPRLADIGEIIGEYQIYNGTGFINALERDCIGRK